MYQSNEEIIALQAIEKEFALEPTLSSICRQIGQSIQNPRLFVFMNEFLKNLFNSYLSQDILQKGIRLLNGLLNRQKFKDSPISSEELSHYINQRYYDILAIFYERAFLKGPDEARKQLNFSYMKKIITEYQKTMSSQQNAIICGQLLQKIEQIVQQTSITTGDEFGSTLFDSLDQKEAEILSMIMNEDQSKQPKSSNTFQDKFVASLPQEYQERFRLCESDDMVQFKIALSKEFTKDSQNQDLRKVIDRISGFIFVDKLNNLLNHHYITCNAQKLAQRKNEILKKMQELEKDVLESQKEFREYIDINNVKYFYKALKLKKINVLKTQTLSFRSKLVEFTKQEFNQADWPKKEKVRLQAKKDWQATYKELYNEMIKLIPNTEEMNKIFTIIQNIQQLHIGFLKYRWFYQLLITIVICDGGLNQSELDQAIDVIFNLAYTTTKSNLSMTFPDIIRKFVEKSEINLQNDTFEKNQQLFNYQIVQYLENQFLYINNKLARLYIKHNQFCPRKVFEDICLIELQFILECNNSLKNYKKVNDRLADVFNEGEREEKDSKLQFFKILQFSYPQKLQQLLKDKNNKQVQLLLYFQLNINKFKQEYKKGSQGQLAQYIDILAKEEKTCQIIEQFFIKEIERLSQLYPQFQEVKELYYTFVDIFLKDNPFIFYISALKGCFSYCIKKTQIQNEKIEKLKFISVAFKDRSQDEINKLIDFIQQSRDTNSLEYQYQIAQNIFNHYTVYFCNQDGSPQTKPWIEKFPNLQEMKSIQDYNTPQFNTICVVTSKFYSNDAKFILKSEEQLKGDVLKKIYGFLAGDKTALESQPDSNQFLAQFYLYYSELKSYKSILIKEVQNYSGDLNLQQVYIDIFSKYSTKVQIINDISEYKRSQKLKLNEIEIFTFTKMFWNTIGQQEIKKLTNTNEQILYRKLQEYYKKLFINNQSQQAFLNALQKDVSNQSMEDQQVKLIISKQYQQYQEELEKISPKMPSTILSHKQPVIQIQAIQKRLAQLRQKDQKLQGYVEEDQSVLTFINDQFNLFMKRILGKVIQTVLTQKPGHEYKVYQNKTVSSQEQQSLRYKQLVDLYSQYGPKKTDLDQTLLLVQGENKTQLFYEFCDYTPIQRQTEFRNCIQEIEPYEEEIQKNKIRKNEWKEEHPELEDILKKRIKRGAELWNQVQDFLSKRETNDNEYDSDEESNRQKIEQSQFENIDFNQPVLKIQELLKSTQSQLQVGKSTIRTRLNNMETDHHLVTQKSVTVKTMQHVLEQDPLFKKSKILYKSYIL